MSHEDMALAERCRTLAGKVTEASRWVDENRDATVRGNTDPLLAQLRASRRALQRYERAAARKMCVGVFGPSQSGKSYLISALARDANGNLLTNLESQTCDFLKDINPEGGKESTGLVTRFTVGAPSDTPPGYPVRIGLLSEMDVIKIIANTFYSDIKHNEAPDAGALSHALDALARRAGPVQPDAPGRDDFEELVEYIVSHFRSTIHFEVMKNTYWPRVVELAPRLGPEDRIELLSYIWGRTELFTRLYRLLREGLQKLDHAREAFCTVQALMPRETSIIDVTALRELDVEGAEMLGICTPGGRRTTLPRAVITALAAELIIVMDQKPHDLFDHTDLLDFPGYRSRLSIDDFEQSVSGGGDLGLDDYFLRGKVSYLFERYCQEKELTSMLLCIGPSNQEVQDLPKAINNWIAGTHGASPAERAGKDIALFLILTKFDMEFEEKKGSGTSAEELQTRWKNRMFASLLGFFGSQHDWPKDWDGGPFRNVFWMRNPSFKARAIFAYDGDRETGILSNQKEFVASMRAAFLATPDINRHFANPAEAWNAAMELNDGGVSYLRDKITPMCNPDIKRRQIAALVREQTGLLTDRLAVYYKSGNMDEELKRKKELGRKMTQLLGRIIQLQRFGELLRELQLPVHDCFDLYLQAENPPPPESEGVDDRNPPQTSGVVFGERTIGTNIFDELFGDAEPVETSAPDGGSAATDQEEIRDEAQYFSVLLEKHWISILTQLAEDKAMQQYFALSAKEFSEFVHELIQGGNRLGIRRQVEQTIRSISQYRNVSREKLAWKQASLGTAIFGSYIDWLGYDPGKLPATRRQVSIEGRPRTLFTEPPDVIGLPELPTEQTHFDRPFYVDWTAAFYDLMVSNVAFAGQEFDLEQNSRLGSILQALK